VWRGGDREGVPFPADYLVRRRNLAT